MMDDEDLPLMAWLMCVTFLVLFLLVWAFVPTAHAQRMDDVLALGAVCVSEAGFDVHSDECSAIASVLRSRCRGCTMATAARLYSRRVFDNTRRDSRAWLAHLRPDGGVPSHWPSNASWAQYRSRWLGVLDLAGSILRGDVVHRCEMPPAHWGGIVDDRRARRMRLVRIDCGSTRNRFYVLPSTR